MSGAEGEATPALPVPRLGCSSAGCPSSAPAAAERVLQRPHRLQDAALTLAPHYPFLEPPEGDAEAPPDADPTPDTATAASPDTDPSAPTSPVPVEPLALSPVPVEPPAAFPGGDEGTEGAAGGGGQRRELAGSAQDEALVPAEPGALRYLQRHYQDLLASIPEVSLLPLEGEDVAGFRVSCGQGCGQGSACGSHPPLLAMQAGGGVAVPGGEGCSPGGADAVGRP